MRCRARLASAAITLALYGAVLAVLAFFYLPILALMMFSFTASRLPTLPVADWTLAWYAALLARGDLWPALANTAALATLTTGIATALGVGGAVAWTRYRFRFKRLFQALAIAPLAFPQILLGIALLLWISVAGAWLGVGTSLAAAVLGNVVHATPFALVIVALQRHGLDQTLEDAARDAGASPRQVFLNVTWPLMRPGVSVAAVFVFLSSWGNFHVTYNLAGGATTLPTFVYSGLAAGSTPVYPALATLTFVPALGLLALAEWRRRRGAGRGSRR